MDTLRASAEGMPLDPQGIKKMISDEARLLRDEAVNSLGQIAAFVAENGKIRPFKAGVEKEEFLSNVPSYLRAKGDLGKPADEMAQNAFDAGLIEEPTTASLYEALKSLPAKLPTIKQFIGEAESTIKERIKGFKRVQPGLRKEIDRTLGLSERPDRKFTEKFALARSLQRQAYAAAQAARFTREELNNLKKQIADEANKYLPVSERGWLNGLIARASTSKDLAKATARIHNRLTELIRRDMVAELKSTATKAIESSAVDAEYQQRIKSIIDRFQFKGKSQDTLSEIQELEDYVNKQRAQGKDVNLPNRYLESFKILRRRSVQDLTIKELANLLNTVELLENLGRQRIINIQAEYQREKSKLAESLINGVQPIERKEIVEPAPGVALSVKEYLSNKLVQVQNAAKRIGLALTPMDAIMDMADGIQNYAGPHSRMKSLIDSKHDLYLDDRRRWTSPVIELAEELKLGDTNFERIAVYAYRIQDNGREYLLNNGLTDEEIDSIQLTEEEMRLYQSMRKAIETPYDRVVQTVRQLSNRVVGKLQNYFPVQIDFSKVADVEVFDRVGDMLDAGSFGLKTKTVQQGFTKQRTGTKRAIKLNAMDTFLRHMDNVSYLVNMQRAIKMVSEVVNAPRYRERAGDIGALIMSQWADTLARNGGGEGLKRIELLDTVRQNFGVAQLGFRLSSILVQPTSFFDGAAVIGAEYAMTGFQDVVTDPAWRKFLVEHLPELRERGAGDPAFQDLSADKRLRKIQDLGYSYLKKVDLLTASAIAAGAYRKSLAERGIPLDLNQPDKTGILEAERLLRRSQSSGFSKDIPQALSRGALTGNKSLDKLILQFRSFQLTRWSQIRHDLWRAGVRENNYQRASEIAFWLSLAQFAELGIRYGNRFLLASAVGGLGYALKDLDKDFEDLPEDIFLQFVGNVPFLGDFASAIAFEGRKDLIPAASVVSDIIQGASRIASAPSGKKRRDRTTRLVGGTSQLLSGIAAGLGLPGSGQVDQLVQNYLRSQKRK